MAAPQFLEQPLSISVGEHLSALCYEYLGVVWRDSERLIAMDRARAVEQGTPMPAEAERWHGGLTSPYARGFLAFPFPMPLPSWELLITTNLSQYIAD